MTELIKLKALPSNGFQVDGLLYRAAKDGNGVEVARFYDRKVSEIVIPEKIAYNKYTYEVTRIADCPFSGCKELKSITIPNSITSIQDGLYRGAFDGCSSLTSIIVQNGNPKYDSRNNCNAIIETRSNTLIAGCPTTIIPNSITSIGYYAFKGCSGLTSITIPNSVKNIGESAFYGCKGLTSITIPNSVENIGDSAFNGCESLTSITIPNSVKNIGESAFYGCI